MPDNQMGVLILLAAGFGAWKVYQIRKNKIEQQA
jgi:hypothetical protein